MYSVYDSKIQSNSCVTVSKKQNWVKSNGLYDWTTWYKWAPMRGSKPWEGMVAYRGILTNKGEFNAF